MKAADWLGMGHFFKMWSLKCENMFLLYNICDDDVCIIYSHHQIAFKWSGSSNHVIDPLIRIRAYTFGFLSKFYCIYMQVSQCLSISQRSVINKYNCKTTTMFLWYTQHTVHICGFFFSVLWLRCLCGCFTSLCFPLTVLLSVCPPRGANPLDHRDNSFSRSRSSSVTSIDKEAKEAVSSFHFSESFARKGDSTLTPCLYVGTSLGTVLALAVTLPPAGEQRQLQPVIIAPTGGCQERGWRGKSDVADDAAMFIMKSEFFFFHDKPLPSTHQACWYGSRAASCGWLSSTRPAPWCPTRTSHGLSPTWQQTARKERRSASAGPSRCPPPPPRTSTRASTPWCVQKNRPKSSPSPPRPASTNTASPRPPSSCGQTWCRWARAHVWRVSAPTATSWPSGETRGSRK